MGRYLSFQCDLGRCLISLIWEGTCLYSVIWEGILSVWYGKVPYQCDMVSHQCDMKRYLISLIWEGTLLVWYGVSHQCDMGRYLISLIWEGTLSVWYDEVSHQSDMGLLNEIEFSTFLCAKRADGGTIMLAARCWRREVSCIRLGNSWSSYVRYASRRYRSAILTILHQINLV